jgi:glutamyl-tRNA reductase
MRIGVVGVNYKLADLKLRETLAKTCLKYFGPHNASSSCHFIVLSTCNRTEIYFVTEDLAAAHTYILNTLRKDTAKDFEQKLYSFFGEDCFLHLCRVTAGLDSAIVAETEIQGQVKAAYECAAETFSLPEELHYLFQKSLKIGKQVRSQLAIQRGLPDLEHAILQTAQQLFGSRFDAKILFVGASAINQKIMSFFKGRNFDNITICNRTAILANDIAQRYNCRQLPWNSLSTAWHQYDWIIFGTKAPEPLIHRHSLPVKQQGRWLIIDLSVPRNVEASLANDSRVTLLNIDQLDQTLSFRRNQIHHLLSMAENLITHQALQHVENFKQRQKQRELWLAAV